MQALNDVKIIFYYSIIYVPQSLHRSVLDWYHLYLNHPGGNRLAKTIQEVCYWKVLVTQAELFAKMCKTCQQFKKRKTLYVHLPSKNIAEIKPWGSVHIDLIGQYSNSIIQQQTGGAIIWKNASLTFMTIIEPATGCLDIFKIPTFDLNEVMSVNYEYIDKSSTRVGHIFNNT